MTNPKFNATFREVGCRRTLGMMEGGRFQHLSGAHLPPRHGLLLDARPLLQLFQPRLQMQLVRAGGAVLRHQDLVQQATKHASFKVGCGPIRQFGEFATPLWTWSAEDPAPAHIHNSAPNSENGVLHGAVHPEAFSASKTWFVQQGKKTVPRTQERTDGRRPALNEVGSGAIGSWCPKLGFVRPNEIRCGQPADLVQQAVLQLVRGVVACAAPQNGGRSK